MISPTVKVIWTVRNWLLVMKSGIFTSTFFTCDVNHQPIWSIVHIPDRVEKKPLSRVRTLEKAGSLCVCESTVRSPLTLYWKKSFQLLHTLYFAFPELNCLQVHWKWSDIAKKYYSSSFVNLSIGSRFETAESSNPLTAPHCFHSWSCDFSANIM